MDFVSQKEGGTVSFRFSSFLLYSVLVTESWNDKSRQRTLLIYWYKLKQLKWIKVVILSLKNSRHKVAMLCKIIQNFDGRSKFPAAGMNKRFRGSGNG
jgi:hypothetical protein